MHWTRPGCTARWAAWRHYRGITATPRTSPAAAMHTNAAEPCTTKCSLPAWSPIVGWDTTSCHVMPATSASAATAAAWNCGGKKGCTLPARYAAERLSLLFHTSAMLLLAAGCCLRLQAGLAAQTEAPAAGCESAPRASLQAQHEWGGKRAGLQSHCGRGSHMCARPGGQAAHTQPAVTPGRRRQPGFPLALEAARCPCQPASNCWALIWARSLCPRQRWRDPTLV